MTEKVSVIIPIYKVEKYLDRCVQSVLKQTYKNLEIILVDDGSPDQCPRMCDVYAAADDRVIVHHQSNKGISIARNTGLDLATGTYILCVDSDDYIDEDMVEKMIAPFAQPSVMVSVCGVKMETQTGSQMETKLYPKKALERTMEISSLQEEMYLGNRIRTWMWNKMYRASMIGTLRYDTELKKFEDIDFQARLCEGKQGMCVCIPDYCYHYQIRKDGLSGQAAHQLESFEYLIQYTFKEMAETPALMVRKIRIYLSQLQLIRGLPKDGSRTVSVQKDGTFTAYSVDEIKKRNIAYIRTHWKLKEVKTRLSWDTQVRCSAAQRGWIL